MNISKEMEKDIIESTFIRVFKRNSQLLKEGDISQECFFIIKGCIRAYYVKDGEEITTNFYMENEAVTPSAYGQNTLSKYYLECIEDTMICVGTVDKEIEIYKKYPALESLTRTFGENLIAKQQETIDEFKMSTPEERYLHLIKNRADLIQRVPQHQIASYLGIKPESLSRIRKRIFK